MYRNQVEIGIYEVVCIYPLQVLREILANWDIETVLSLDRIHVLDGAKVSETTWAVGDSLILKSGNREKLLKNINVARALDRIGFVSSLPVPTRTGSEYVDVDDKEGFVLTRRLQGKPLSKSIRYGDQRIEYGEQYGRSIGRLHKALEQVQNKVSLGEVNLFRSIIERALPDVRKQNKEWNMGLDDSLFSDYVDSFGQLCNQLPTQLIHRDPNPDNILFMNGKVSAFIDFDLSEINTRLWDACYCATSILSESSHNDFDLWLDILGGILRGYDHEVNLTSEEKHAVFYVLCSIQLICVSYFASHEQYKELAVMNRKMLALIVRHRTRIELRNR
jgi:Ser/Thr protein kinase RdoA (MazF antagonist)